MSFLKRFLARLRFSRLAPNADEWSAAAVRGEQSQLGTSHGAPPGWVPPADEGRPRR